MLINHSFFIGLCLGFCALLQSTSIMASSCQTFLAQEGLTKTRGKNSAVELEMRVNEQLMFLLTTTDGTLAPLLGNEEVPEDVKAWKLNHGGNVASAKDLRWDTLPHSLKMSLINHYTQNINPTSFNEDRQIHPLRTKPSIEVYLDKPLSVFGKIYGIGLQSLQLRPFLEEKVEYRSSSDLESFSGVELHLRSFGLDAGSILESAKVLEELLEVRRGPFHVHLIAGIPSFLREEKREELALEITDYYRRVNIFAELLSIATGENVGTRVVAGAVQFGYLKPGKIKRLFRHLVKLSKGEQDILGDDLKDAWVAFRGSDKYEGEDLWGLEFRSISRNSPIAVYTPILRQLEASFQSHQYGTTYKDLEASYSYGERSSPESIVDAMSEASYHQSWTSLWSHLPREMIQHLESQNLTSLKLARLERGERLKILFFDWSHEPFLKNHPDLIELIQVQQLYWVKEIFAQGNPSQNQIKIGLTEFLKESGLLTLFGRSVGIEVP